MGKKSRLVMTGFSYQERVVAAKEREEKRKKEEAEKLVRMALGLARAVIDGGNPS